MGLITSARGVCKEKGTISCEGKELVQTRFAQTHWVCFVYAVGMSPTYHAMLRTAVDAIDNSRWVDFIDNMLAAS